LGCGGRVARGYGGGEAVRLYFDAGLEAAGSLPGPFMRSAGWGGEVLADGIGETGGFGGEGAGERIGDGEGGEEGGGLAGGQGRGGAPTRWIAGYRIGKA
jgi:hypothetical protein